jgi:uncharacterized protein with GYD domain
MAKYLINASYTADGAKGLIKEGGTNRQKLVEGMVRKLGGTIEAFYYSFGPSDVVAIVEMPNAATAAAMSMGITSTGAVDIELTPLIEPKEIDTAAKMTIGYRPPGN